MPAVAIPIPGSNYDVVGPGTGGADPGSKAEPFLGRIVDFYFSREGFTVGAVVTDFVGSRN